jgi:hypothetical protein
MIVNVWLIYKAGEPRVYSWTVEPSREQKTAFLQQGFTIFRANIDLPIDLETPVVTGYVHQMERFYGGEFGGVIESESG